MKMLRGNPLRCSQKGPDTFRILIAFPVGCAQRSLTKLGAVFQYHPPIRKVPDTWGKEISCKHRRPKKC